MKLVLIGFNDVPEGNTPICIRECWGDFTYRGPFKSKEEAYTKTMALYDSSYLVLYVPFNIAGEQLEP